MILLTFFDILLYMIKDSLYLRAFLKNGSKNMIQRDVTVTNNIGLHARPATFFIQKANSFKSSIWIEKDERKVNAKSLLGVLSMGIAKGMTVTLVADGTDEDTALDALVALVQTGFAE